MPPTYNFFAILFFIFVFILSCKATNSLSFHSLRLETYEKLTLKSLCSFPKNKSNSLINRHPSHYYRINWLVIWTCLDICYLVHHILTRNNFTKNSVIIWQRIIGRHYKKLTAVCVGTCICHGHYAFFVSGFV